MTKIWFYPSDNLEVVTGTSKVTGESLLLNTLRNRFYTVNLNVKTG